MLISDWFRHPQGVVRHGDNVWVCDTDNNVLRCINTVSRSVATVQMSGAPGLSSPWDLCHLAPTTHSVSGECLLVAMAGCHQLWMYCLTDVVWWKSVEYSAGSMVCVVGSGKEENRNNSYPAKVSETFIFIKYSVFGLHGLIAWESCPWVDQEAIVGLEYCVGAFIRNL